MLVVTFLRRSGGGSFLLVLPPVCLATGLGVLWLSAPVFPPLRSFLRGLVFGTLLRVFCSTFSFLELLNFESLAGMSGTVLISHLDSRGIFLLSGELGIGVPCCAAQADRDPSETPLQHEGWSTTEDESAGVWG